MDLIARLRAGLPGEAILTDPDVTGSYAHDMASFCEAGTPAVVVLPRTVEQVQHIMRTATELRIPVVPQGARTGLSGAANASDGCLVLSLVKMDRIIEINPVDRIAVVEPGVINAVALPRGERTRALLPARPLQLGGVLHRREHRHRLRRPVLRQVRRHRRVRPRPGRRPRRRAAADDRPAHRQGRRGLRPHPAVRRLRGQPGHRRTRRPRPQAGAAAAARAGRRVPLHRGRLRGRLRDHGPRPRPLAAGADGPYEHPRRQRHGADGPPGQHRGAAAGRLRHPRAGRRPRRRRRSCAPRRAPPRSCPPRPPPSPICCSRPAG